MIGCSQFYAQSRMRKKAENHSREWINFEGIKFWKACFYSRNSIIIYYSMSHDGVLSSFCAQSMIQGNEIIFEDSSKILRIICKLNIGQMSLFHSITWCHDDGVHICLRTLICEPCNLVNETIFELLNNPPKIIFFKSEIFRFLFLSHDGVHLRLRTRICKPMMQRN